MKGRCRWQEGSGCCEALTASPLDCSRFEAEEIESSVRFQLGWLVLEVCSVLLVHFTHPLKVFAVPLFLPIAIAAGIRLLFILPLLLSRRAKRYLVHPFAMMCLLLDVGVLATYHPEVSPQVWDRTLMRKGPPQNAAPKLKLNNKGMRDMLEELNASMSAETSTDGDAGNVSCSCAPCPLASSHNSSHFLDSGGKAAPAENKKKKNMKRKSSPKKRKKSCNTFECWSERLENETESMEREANSQNSEWAEEQDELRHQYINEYVVVVFGISMQLWYMTSFVLPFRKAVCVLPLCIGLLFVVAVCLGRELQPDHEHVIVLRRTLEMMIFVFCACVSLIAKFRVDRSQRQLCKLMDQKAKEVIQEKVLRCNAEFEKEKLRDDMINTIPEDCVTESYVAPGFTADELLAGRPNKVHSLQTSTVKARGPASLRSAPPATRGFLQEGNPQAGTRQKGDCLPPGAAVWVEGQPMPTAVNKVGPGQRVLCFDTVGRCPKFVEVTEANVLAGEAEWVVIQLADGTELSVTANHPVQPQPLGTERLPYIGSAVQAKNLRPGSDCLMVLKLVPVAVTNVTPPEDASPTERVSLLLKQPERHEVFVAPPNANPQAATVAVGSANAGYSVPGMQMPFGPVVKRTFIDVAPTEDSPYPLRRSNSLPPRLPASSGGFTELNDHDKRDVQSVQRPQVYRKTPQRRRRLRSNSDSDISTSLRSSESSIGAQVLLSMTGGEMGKHAMLSEVMHARQTGLPSIGSAGHKEGDCQVCIFHSRHVYEGAAPCWKGVLCDRCHDCHEPLGKKKQKSGSMRRYLKKCGRECTTEAL